MPHGARPGSDRRVILKPSTGDRSLTDNRPRAWGSDV